MQINEKGITILTPEDVEQWDDKGKIRAMVRVTAICFDKNEFIIRGIIDEVKAGTPLYVDRKRTVTVKGHFERPTIGKTYMLVGFLLPNSNNPSYNPAYDAYYFGTEISLETPQDKRNFLSSILTTSQVTNLYNTFSNPFQIIQQKDKQSLMKVKGIGSYTADKIIDKYERNIAMGALLAFFEEHHLNVGSGTLNKLITHYGTAERALTKIKENPYQLIDEVEGIGWKKADSIALKMGLNPLSIQRFQAYCIYRLKKLGEDNGTAIPCYKLWKETDVVEDLGINYYRKDIALLAMQQLIEEGVIKKNADQPAITWIGLTSDYYLEARIFKELQRLNNAPLTYEKPQDFEEKLLEVEEKQGFKFNPEQRKAIDDIFKHNVIIITGKAGTGKTTVTNGFLNACEDIIPVLCALSGKAAQRISEVSKKPASTIHRLLSANQRGIYADVVIIDEASMIGTDLFFKLLFAIPDGTKVIIMGDIAQLDAVGKGNVLRDITQKGSPFHICNLTQIHRQAAQSGIVTQSLLISSCQPIYPDGFLGTAVYGEDKDFFIDIHYRNDKDPAYEFLPMKKVLQHWKQEYENVKHDIKKLAVITPRRDETLLNAFDLNHFIQEIYNPHRDESEWEDPYEECQIWKARKQNKEKSVSIQKTEIPDNDRLLTFRKRDRVLITKNDYQTVRPDGLDIPTLLSPEWEDYLEYVKSYRAETSIYNGYLGTIEAVNEYGMIVNCDNAGRVYLPSTKFEHIDLGYAVTVHKYQGSECHTVIFAIDGSSSETLNCQMLYTGVTRAKKKCVVIADREGFNLAIITNKERTKYTFLQLFVNITKAHWDLPTDDYEYDKMVRDRGHYSLVEYKKEGGIMGVSTAKEDKDLVPFEDHFHDKEEDFFNLPF